MVLKLLWIKITSKWSKTYQKSITVGEQELTGPRDCATASTHFIHFEMSRWWPGSHITS